MLSQRMPVDRTQRQVSGKDEGREEDGGKSSRSEAGGEGDDALPESSKAKRTDQATAVIKAESR